MHAFDFKYFYGEEIDRYVSSIWVSWGTIPTVASRVPEYVQRTLCTIALCNLAREDTTAALTDARQRVEAVLQRHARADSAAPHFAEALAHINLHWKQIHGRIHARLGLLKIARYFLFSDAAGAAVRADKLAVPTREASSGYRSRVREFESIRFSNPLRFLEAHTRPSDPSAADSLWLLSNIAFNFDAREA